MKSMLYKLLSVSAFALTSVLSTTASAEVMFTITHAQFTMIGAGYGNDTNPVENNGTPVKLDVTFTNTPFTSMEYALTLDAPTSEAFKFGTVNFRELDIALSEIQGDLTVKASFTFSQPGVGSQTVETTGIPVLGPSNGPGENNLVDFSIDWAPMLVNFGTTGSFLIDVTDLAFTQQNQTRDATARITLLSEDTPPQGTVPEPGSLALAGLGMLAAGLVRRRKH